MPTDFQYYKKNTKEAVRLVYPSLSKRKINELLKDRWEAMDEREKAHYVQDASLERSLRAQIYLSSEKGRKSRDGINNVGKRKRKGMSKAAAATAAASEDYYCDTAAKTTVSEEGANWRAERKNNFPMTSGMHDKQILSERISGLYQTGLPW